MATPTTAENAQSQEPPKDNAEEAAFAFYGYLFDKSTPGKIHPTPVLDALLRAIAIHTVRFLAELSRHPNDPMVAWRDN
jgi:hypothetical protein